MFFFIVYTDLTASRAEQKIEIKGYIYIGIKYFRKLCRYL